ncbi:hypothetical protein [Sinomicrobium oceani]|uniref:hypothetical protein n=1 Tax=Sinomicrobium oceani TaxID=1150368 RepID=UPI00227AAF31|nr:hypothetical protein [Sinomicrobium oceani]
MENLNFSIFYDCNYWYKIINDVINPFLKNNAIENYIIILSEERGDHIKLTITSEKNSSVVIANKLHTLLKNYLKHNPSPPAKNLIPNKGLFKDFDGNTLHHGIFDIARQIDSFKIPLSNAFMVSKVSLEIFKEHKENTLELLTEIILELLLISINVLIANQIEPIALFSKLFNSELKKYDKNDRLLIEQTNKLNFEKNKSEILDYIKPFLSDELQFKQNTWKHIWQKTLNNQLNLISGNKINLQVQYSRTINYLFFVFNFEEVITVYYVILAGMKEV